MTEHNTKHGLKWCALYAGVLAWCVGFIWLAFWLMPKAWK